MPAQRSAGRAARDGDNARSRGSRDLDAFGAHASTRVKAAPLRRAVRRCTRGPAVAETVTQRTNRFPINGLAHACSGYPQACQHFLWRSGGAGCVCGESTSRVVRSAACSSRRFANRLIAAHDRRSMRRDATRRDAMRCDSLRDRCSKAAVSRVWSEPGRARYPRTIGKPFAINTLVSLPNGFPQACQHNLWIRNRLRMSGRRRSTHVVERTRALRVVSSSAVARDRSAIRTAIGVAHHRVDHVVDAWFVDMRAYCIAVDWVARLQRFAAVAVQPFVEWRAQCHGVAGPHRVVQQAARLPWATARLHDR
ncbi:hypothetical protein BDO18943_04544 [Burkholderia dolosa]|nr:hypothetical protein BDO18943_04544 [Burkholderia dolosa]